MSPQKRPFPWEDEDAHPTRGSLGPQESTSQTAFQKAQAFRITMCSTDHRTSVTCIVMQRKKLETYWLANPFQIVQKIFRSVSLQQEAQISPSDRAMHLVSSNLANCHATVQKLLIRQVLTKLMV